MKTSGNIRAEGQRVQAFSRLLVSSLAACLHPARGGRRGQVGRVTAAAPDASNTGETGDAGEPAAAAPGQERSRP